MDAAALGGWTARGTAKVLMDRLVALQPDQRPAWMEGLTTQKLEDLLTKVIVDSVEASQVVQEYMDTERVKGRDFDDIYADVKPYLDRVSRPIEEDMKDGTLDQATEDLMNAAETELEAKVAAREKRHHRAPHRNLAAREPTGLDSIGEPAGLGVVPPTISPAQQESRRSPATPTTAPERPLSDTMRSMDLGEPLVLVGSCNGWRVDEARRLHRFQPSEGAESAHESYVRVKVPSGGLRFLILSAEKEWQWRLFPSQKGTLHRGEERAQAAGLAMGPDADEKARGKDFKVKGDKGYGVVDVRVALDLDRGARVWISEVTDTEAPAAITFPGME